MGLALAPPPDAAATADMASAVAALCKKRLHYFVKKTWSIVEPAKPLVWNWHLDEMCAILEAISWNDREVVPEDDVVFNVPPGTMKSLLVSVFFPAWEWASRPALRYLCGSYGMDLSIRDNLRLRSILTSYWYQTHFPRVLLKEDQNAKERFSTTAGGWRIATSPGGVGIGEHPDRVILDDLLTEDQARSDDVRENVNTWIDRTIAPRGVARGVRRILVMQRLHHEDPTAHVLKKGGWKHIVFPMRFVPRRAPTASDPGYTPDPRDHRTQPGELLFPQLFDDITVRKLEIRLGPHGTAGQLQQQPSIEGGGLFKKSWFGFVEAAPVVARRVRCWDTAATENGGDWTVGAKLAEANNIVYVEHVLRGQWSPSEVDAIMVQTAQIDGRAVSQRELKEPAASGKTVIAARTKLLKGFDHAGVTVSGDKVTMAKPFRAQCEAGNVKIVRTGDAVRDAWIEPFLTELAQFPTGTDDDQVDAAANGYNQVLLEPAAGPVITVRVRGM